MDIAVVLASDPARIEALSRLSIEPDPDVPVLSAKVKLLWHCNLSCTFCRLPEPGDVMSRETALGLGRELVGLGLRKVHFSGGEVLLHPQCFDIFGDWAKLGVQVNLTSNGFVMGKEEVLRLEDCGVHSVSLSIDAADRKLHDKLRGHKGSHKAVIRAAGRIAGRGRMKLRINTVVTSRNIACLADLREVVRGLGPNVAWKLIPVDPVEPGLAPSRSAVAEAASEVKQWGELEDRTPFGTSSGHYRRTAAGRHGFRSGMCYVPWFHLFFTPEGLCYPCCMTRGSIDRLGSYPRESVKKIVQGAAMRRLRSRMASGGRLDSCASCDDFLTEGRAIAKLIAGRSL